LKKGKYALYTIPNIQSWEVIFILRQTIGVHQKNLMKQNALRTVVKEEATPKAIETFTIGINGLDTNFAYLEIYWRILVLL
jgi:hypothetical protein